MTCGCDNRPIPLVTREHGEFRIVVESLGRDREICLPFEHLLGHLVGAALMQDQVHVGIGLTKLLDDLRQRVTRLGVGGREH
jgi:hypothetical protein